MQSHILIFAWNCGVMPSDRTESDFFSLPRGERGSAPLQEVVSIGVEKELGDPLLSGDACWFLFLPHSLCQTNSSSSALASLRFAVSNPSVN